jgi:hypothetical protein
MNVETVQENQMLKIPISMTLYIVWFLLKKITAIKQGHTSMIPMLLVILLMQHLWQKNGKVVELIKQQGT